MATHDIGEKPGKGRYCCTNCNGSVVLDDDSDRLPPCGSCGSGQQTKYEDCGHSPRRSDSRRLRLRVDRTLGAASREGEVPAVPDGYAEHYPLPFSDARTVIIDAVAHSEPRAGEDYPAEDEIPSPGGWTAPADCRPGWDWVPPCGATPVPQPMAWSIRALYRTPFLDRYAHQIMWARGGLLVLPPDHWWLNQ